LKKLWARVDLRHPAFGRFERQDHVKGSLMWRQTLPDTGVNAMSEMNRKYLIKKYFGHERSVLMKNFTLYFRFKQGGQRGCSGIPLDRPSSGVAIWPRAHEV
jgi:hypothetical protein